MSKDIEGIKEEFATDICNKLSVIEQVDWLTCTFQSQADQYEREKGEMVGDIIETINSVKLTAIRTHANDTTPEKAEVVNEWLMPEVKRNLIKSIAQKYGVDLSE